MFREAEVSYTTQFCQDGCEISGGIYDAEDADMVRYWQGDFCLVELTKQVDGTWRPTGGDSVGWTDLADSYAEPIDALYALLPSDGYILIDANE